MLLSEMEIMPSPQPSILLPSIVIAEERQRVLTGGGEECLTAEICNQLSAFGKLHPKSKLSR